MTSIKLSIKPSIKSFILCVLLLSILFSFSVPAFAADSGQPQNNTFYTNLNENNTLPDGAVYLIVDGLGSYYLFPELKGETLSGESVQKASLSVLPNIWDRGFRISQMKVPVPVTEKGHSVLVTGNPSADAEIVGYAESTVMDVLREEGFLCIGIMQRGDFESMRSKFDVIIYDKTNSVNNMDFTIQQNSFNGSNQAVINDIVSVFNFQKNRALSYINTKDTSEKYAGYNRWGLDTACEVLSVMEKYPGQKFILVISVGAVDSTGHYRGYFAYLDAVEKLDKDLEKLFEKCRRNNLFFLLTADHGMAFEEQNKKGGGHSSTKYSKTKESLNIPFIVYGNSIQKNVVYYEQTGQEDIAPTLLSLFNIQTHPRFSKGKVLPAKEKAAFYLQAPEPVQIRLFQLTGDGESEVFNSLGFNRNAVFSQYSIAGLTPGSYLLKWDTADSKMKYVQSEIRFQITSDTSIDLSDYLIKSSDSLLPISNVLPQSDSKISSKYMKPIYYLLIAVINIAGIGGIYYFYKKSGFSKI
ncbi:sulfatase-like hydrolase/transferase [Methanimicrococcus blatticola]|uniref:Phosphoglycerate mutase n=1 Tax=Methanimicrococcus blatticola TaxID=91560 RepID=A0A484F8I8_9EURY|nr:sulfatase-like hydrolase/transferase [Methanimicrococcus blatticola]MBZ3934885.1 sulfatase-like hydrolase/transferase [Methanimicrococcus blatticola]MCC2509016.1 alkaline phosphatase family protein [Methanimicrococcus blatticola]TDQ70957.1 phosphoglycerate mutase [Methanimicrococcus blatticola]